LYNGEDLDLGSIIYYNCAVFMFFVKSGLCFCSLL